MIDPSEISSEDTDQPRDLSISESLPDDLSKTSEAPVEKQLTPDQITRLAIWLELFLVVVALALAFTLDFYDHQRPLTTWYTGHWIGSLLIGCLAAFPMLLLILVILPRVPVIGPQLKSLEDTVTPIFLGIKFWQVVVISLAAGIGEEILFRWCLQGGIAQSWPMAAALVTASVIFGICHYLNTTYFILTTLIGVLLGLIYLYVGPLAAIACHAAYDFFAIRYLVARYESAESQGEVNNL